MYLLPKVWPIKSKVIKKGFLWKVIEGHNRSYFQRSLLFSELTFIIRNLFLELTFFNIVFQLIY